MRDIPKHSEQNYTIDGLTMSEIIGQCRNKEIRERIMKWARSHLEIYVALEHELFHESLEARQEEIIAIFIALYHFENLRAEFHFARRDLLLPVE